MVRCLAIPTVRILAWSSLALAFTACGETPEPVPDFACATPDPVPTACPAGVTTGLPKAERDVVAVHIDDKTAIAYAAVPPTVGNHRGMWAAWGEYTFLPPQRWLHNLEHGGAAFLYQPCAPKATIDALRAFVQKRPADSGGRFRYVLTPFPGLKTPIAVVTWGWKFEGTCVGPTDTAAIEAFLQAHYRDAPEDFDFPGTFKDGWISYVAAEPVPAGADAAGSDAGQGTDAADTATGLADAASDTATADSK